MGSKQKTSNRFYRENPLTDCQNCCHSLKNFRFAFKRSNKKDSLTHAMESAIFQMKPLNWTLKAYDKNHTAVFSTVLLAQLYLTHVHASLNINNTLYFRF